MGDDGYADTPSASLRRDPDPQIASQPHAGRRPSPIAPGARTRAWRVSAQRKQLGIDGFPGTP